MMPDQPTSPRPTEQPEDLQRAAYHEAANAVIAYEVGWWINDEGVQIDERQYTGLRHRRFDDTTDSDVIVSLAGWPSGFKITPRSHHPNPQKRQTMPTTILVGKREEPPVRQSDRPRAVWVAL
jgi:hypothetical protein